MQRLFMALGLILVTAGCVVYTLQVTGEPVYAVGSGPIIVSPNMQMFESMAQALVSKDFMAQIIGPADHLGVYWIIDQYTDQASIAQIGEQADELGICTTSGDMVKVWIFQTTSGLKCYVVG